LIKTKYSRKKKNTLEKTASKITLGDRFIPISKNTRQEFTVFGTSSAMPLELDNLEMDGKSASSYSVGV
jgi:hypothetical protein